MGTLDSSEALRPRQISSRGMVASDDVRCLTRTRYVFCESEDNLQWHCEGEILLIGASDVDTRADDSFGAN